jgi:hypothetical protein
VIGDDRERTVQGVDYLYEADTDVNPADPLISATFTLRNNVTDTVTYALQKTVTATLVSGTGQIVDSGATDGQATVNFYLLAAETLALAARDFFFTVLCTTTSGADFYAARGIWANQQP